MASKLESGSRPRVRARVAAMAPGQVLTTRMIAGSGVQSSRLAAAEPATRPSAAARERAVLLRADARTPHQSVVAALDAVGQRGFRRVAIATAQSPGGARAR